jgi:hypothetical protein
VIIDEGPDFVLQRGKSLKSSQQVCWDGFVNTLMWVSNSWDTVNVTSVSILLSQLFQINVKIATAVPEICTVLNCSGTRGNPE